MADPYPVVTVSHATAEESIHLSRLEDIPATLQAIARMVASGELDTRNGNCVVMAAGAATRAHCAASEIAERERKSTSQLSEEELADALSKWRRRLIEDAHATLVNGPRADGVS